MRVVVLDEAELAAFSDPHEWLKQKLELPEWYGGNLDALWDCLKGEVSLPLAVRWTARLQTAGDDEETRNELSRIVELLREAAMEMDEFIFEYKNEQ